MPHVELNNESEWGNWYRAARTVLTRRPTDGCGIDNPSEEMIEDKAVELKQANHQHLSDDHWVSNDSASTPVDSDARWFADLYNDVEIYVSEDFCPAEEPAPQPIQIQPEPSPVTPPAPSADVSAEASAEADDGDAGTVDSSAEVPMDIGTEADADGDTVVDADQAETEDAARRRDAQRRENGAQPRDAGQPIIPGT